MSSKKRSFWALIGKILWTVISFVLRIVARLGSTWARKKLDQHAAEHPDSKVKRILHPTRR